MRLRRKRIEKSDEKKKEKSVKKVHCKIRINFIFFLKIDKMLKL